MKITAKNNTTKGFLLCFRPFPMEGSIGDVSDNNDSDFKTFSVNEKPKPKPKSKVYSSDKESIDVNHKKTARRILSKIVKAVAFQSSLSKKVGHGKIIQDPSEKIAKVTDFRNQKSRRKSSSSSEENDLKIDSSISNSSILSSSSSLSISCSTSSSSIASSWTSSDSNTSFGSVSGRQKSFRSDSIEDHGKKQNISNDSSSSSKKKMSGICLLLISLFVLIFWGKFFAILCTSTWFYFVSTTRRDSDNETQMLIKLPVEIQSKEYKKKIIMEGFLERNHRGFHLHQQH